MPPDRADGDAEDPDDQNDGAAREGPQERKERDERDGGSDAQPGSDPRPDEAVDTSGGKPGQVDAGCAPEGERVTTDEPTTLEGSHGLIRWFLKTDHAGVTFLREFLWSALVVVLIGALLFAISGVWPPMVAVKSGSMEPHMYRGDLVFVMDNERFTPEEAVHGTGVVPYQVGKESGYRSFGNYGDVIVYRKNGRSDTTPIIHRARFWVSAGENWYDEANPSFVTGDSCDDVPNCPAPHAGFITKGDDNEQYDQVNGISGPVRPDWIKGTAEFRIPWLGHIRLTLSTVSAETEGRKAVDLD